MLLPVFIAGELIIVETPSKAEKSLPEYPVIPTPDLMDPETKREPHVNSNTELEPGVEIVKTPNMSLQGSYSGQQLPTLHNVAAPAASPIFSSYRSVFQGWKNSVPKLYKYPSSEIEVVIYRKNGQIDKVKAAELAEMQQNMTEEDASATEASWDPSKDVSDLFKQDCNSQTAPSYSYAKIAEQFADSTSRETTKNCSQPISLSSSPLRTPLPYFQQYYNPSFDCKLVKENGLVTGFTGMQSQQTSVLHNFLPTDDVKESPLVKRRLFSTSARPPTTEPSSATNSSLQPDVLNVNPNPMKGEMKKNCTFLFGYKLTPSQVTRNNNIMPTVAHKTDKAMAIDKGTMTQNNDEKMSDISTQTDIELKKTSEKTMQHSPITSAAQSQTHDMKSIVQDASCQSAKLQLDSTSVQTDPALVTLRMEVGCQASSPVLTQANQTETISCIHSSCQTVVDQMSEETQTQIRGTDFGCQTVTMSDFKAIQTDETLNPVVDSFCQATTEAVSKSSQVESNILAASWMKDVNIQCSPCYESKEIQLSGSCCYFREKRVRQEYEKKMHSKLHQAHTCDAPEKAVSLPANMESCEETYTEEDVHNLIQKFKDHVKESDTYREELRWQVSQLTRQLVSSRSNLDLESDTQTETDHFEEDF